MNIGDILTTLEEEYSIEFSSEEETFVLEGTVNRLVKLIIKKQSSVSSAIVASNIPKSGAVYGGIAMESISVLASPASSR